MILKLDGFTNEGFGNVVDAEPQQGDVVRDESGSEYRWYPPDPTEVNAPSEPPVQPSKAELLQKVQELIDIVSALKE